jgi:lactate dehydrogenase-like 2-hydroxyacid dehydrogenase
VVYTKRTRLPAKQEQDLGVEWTPDLDDLIKRSDFLCIACDYNPGTRKLIGKCELDLTKPQAYLINTARGRIVDEPEVIKALQEKRIAGAALDVYWNGPTGMIRPSRRIPRCRKSSANSTTSSSPPTTEARPGTSATARRPRSRAAWLR